MINHIQTVLNIPTNDSIYSVISYLKGKSAITIHSEMERVKNEITGKHFSAKMYFANTVGLYEKMLSEYVLHLKEPGDESQLGLSTSK